MLGASFEARRKRGSHLRMTASALPFLLRRRLALWRRRRPWRESRPGLTCRPLQSRRIGLHALPLQFGPLQFGPLLTRLRRTRPLRTRLTRAWIISWIIPARILLTLDALLGD